MGYRTVLVYVGLLERVGPLLDVALPLARSHGAHLIGVTAIPPAHMYAALAGEVSATIIEAEQTLYREEAEAIGKEFARHTGTTDVTVEWRCVDAGPLGVASTVADVASCADLVVASQSNPDEDWETRSAVPEGLVMEAGRPVLLVPFAYKTGEIGRQVLVGWNGHSEAARAVFDALPILREAEHVEIVTIGNPMNASAEVFSPADDIAAALARHNVNVETFQAPDKGGSDGEILLARAAEQGCDLIVIGGYGHSRFREFVFGGVTRHMLMHMTVPVFMSH